MKLYRKTNIVRFDDVVVIDLPDYSKVIDINTYEGGYSNLYYEIIYLSDNEYPNVENKKLRLLSTYDMVDIPVRSYDNNWSKDESVEIDDKFEFFGRSGKLYIFKYEELSAVELRDSKIKELDING